MWLQGFYTGGFAQEKKGVMYYPAEDLTILGKVMPTTVPYHRVDTALYTGLPDNVTKRLTQSAGLAISFKTTSQAIYIKWHTTETMPSAVMTEVAYRGFDLYVREHGAWQYAGVARPRTNSARAATTVSQGMDSTEKEFLLYLPLYTETTHISIGIDEGAAISAGGQPFDHRILVYGSSITQGAAASRPGLAYPARLSRSTGLNFLNLGMGASAQMEKEVADMIAEISADAFVLDCVPNSSPTLIRERTGYLVKAIRARHPDAPIIVMQSVIRESGYVNRATGEKVALQNQYIEEEVMKLQKNGVKNLHLIPAVDFLGHDHEGTVDGTHPNDMGFDRMIQVITPRILAILKQHKIISNKV
ncbi:SGNH/GDSL hydrolase family protein [Olivibacter sp. SDN3]|nr:SGNH/GDSL hydrolase family protein [Olivibacter sp. SDN3]